MNTRRSEPMERVKNVLSPIAKSEINLRKSTYKTVPKATATMQKFTQKSTESKTPESTKYDDDNTTMQRASVSESMSSGATTYEIKENIHTNMKRINQVVRREVAKERKKLKKEEYQRHKAQYRTRIPAPPVYVAPSPIPSFYAPSAYAAPFMCAPPHFAALAHPQPPPYGAPTHPQPPPYGTPSNVIFSSPYAHITAICWVAESASVELLNLRRWVLGLSLLGGRVRIDGTFKTTPVGAGTVTLGWQSPHRWNF
ncbi:uncharacterized protein LOC105252706 [Camponotus floridanus]|uniref:uncharacterized protein LOC105252706 n=1 Tax=Camponotus floridanus TaxID=104421 RepID=UPI000DC66D4B|nr:uncharacterized protein LOC105252706 [Camponotus floridanus]